MATLYAVDVMDRLDSHGVWTCVSTGEPVLVDGVEYVRRGSSVLVLRTAEWQATEAEAVMAAVPKVAKHAALIDEQLRLMQEGRLK